MMVEVLPDGTVLNTWADDDPLARGEWYPDDTRIEQETADGQPRPFAPPRISRRQPADWPGRSARRLVDNRWVPTGAEPRKSEVEQARDAIRSELPRSASLQDVIDYLNKSALVVVDVDRRRPSRAEAERRRS